MDEDLQQRLQQRFPVLYRDFGKIDTSMELGITCGNGYFDLLWHLFEDLEKLDPNLVAVQAKEKFGSLRFYLRQSEIGSKAINPAKLVKDERV